MGDRSRWGIVAAAVLLASGCGEPTPEVESSTAKAKVSGLVTFKGKPLPSGKVSFNPANSERKSAPIVVVEIKDGKYDAETLVGLNQIAVESPSLPRLTGVPAYIVPAGESTHDLELK